MRSLPRCAFVLILIVLSAFAPAAIPVADDAYTEHDYRKAVLAFNRRNLHDVYEKSGKKSAKWDAAVAKFFDAMAVLFSSRGADPVYALPGQVSQEELKALGQAAIDAGCDDPTVRYCQALLLHEENRAAAELLPLMEAVAAQLNAEGAAPSWRGVWAQHRICRLIGRNDAVARANEWERFKQLAIDFIVRGKYQGVDARIIYENIWMTLESEGADYQQAFVKALRATEGGDPWLREMIFGSADIKAAWHFRGGGWANTVTDGGWAGFNRHLAQARDHLAAAWKLQPKFPEAAGEMIIVAMGAGEALNENPRAWFDRAVAAQFDYAPAYSNYLWASRPRWGGTIGRMYDFGVECAQTKRYDTRVPRFLLRTLEDIAEDMNGPSFWRQPGVYEQVTEVYQGMAAHAAKRGAAAGELDQLRSEQAAFTWRVQRYAEARALLDALGARLQHNAFERFGAMGRLAASHAYAMRPELKTFVDNAEQLAAINDVPAAIAVYQASLDDLKPDDNALFFLNSRLKQLQWQKQFEAGEWVDIQPGKDLAGWSPHFGKWTVDERGGVVGTFSKDHTLWMPCQATFLGGGFTIEGNIELLGDGTNSGGVGMTWNALSRYYAFWIRRHDGEGHFDNYFYPGARTKVNLEPSNTFSFTFAGGRAAGVLNGAEVLKDYDVSYLFRDNTRRSLGIGGAWGEAGAKARFTNLRVRTARSAAPAPQD